MDVILTTPSWRRGSRARLAYGVQGDVTSAAALVHLLAAREAQLVGQLQAAMAGAGRDVFDTWMKRSSDLVQAAAEAYMSHVVVTAGQRSLRTVSRQLRPVLASVLRLDCLCRVKSNLHWFLMQSLISVADADKVIYTPLLPGLLVMELCVISWVPADLDGVAQLTATAVTHSHVSSFVVFCASDVVLPMDLRLADRVFRDCAD